jgi:RNA polymerase sigma-70 factor, ECF subfamily
VTGSPPGWARPAAAAGTLAPSPEEHLLLGVEYGDLGGAIGRLSPELRAVVQATILDGLSSREAGRLLGIPAGTVKTRMQRARAQLQEALS